MKTIVYLDQHYVSYLTKARLGVKVYPDVAAPYRDLYTALREAVQRNFVICPLSTFHISESSHDTRLSPELYHTVAELSYGTEFRFWGDILERQVEVMLHRYLGATIPAVEAAWKEAFRGNPHRDFHEPTGPLRGSWADAFVPTHRKAKALHEQEGHPPPVGDFDSQKRAEAFFTLFDFYLGSWVNLLSGRVDMLSRAGMNSLPHLMEAYSKITGEKETAVQLEQLRRFFASDDIISVPLIEILSSLRAALVLDRQRKPRGSDLNDVLIAATVLPYCDVFATDGHMKQLIVALKLDQKYGVRAFGARKADVVGLTSLVRDLA